MTKTRTKWMSLALVLALFSSFGVKADEGMWMLPFLKQQNYAKMKQMGLKLTPEQIYNPGKGSVVDAVVHFDGGCTGEIVSDQGLLFTNHHCGYDQIRAHSSVTDNFLRDGFYAPTMKDELPNPGLVVTFTNEIVELTDYVNKYLKDNNESDPMVYLSRKYLGKIAEQWYTENRGTVTDFIELDLAPYFEGNKFFLSVQTRYKDVRLVAAPPSCIGKFGADTDNWVWPRHSGDFSVFRIYTAPNGDPAEYNAANIPLKPKHALKINARGLNEKDFVMIIGFPGRTQHFYTPAEVAERRDIDNTVRVAMREVRQETMLKDMLADEAINIQYASKYASSTNAYKNAIGSNWAIKKMNFERIKKEQMDKLDAYARQNNKPEYRSAIAAIKGMVSDRADLRKRQWMIEEGIFRPIEILKAPILKESTYNKLAQDPQARQAFIDKEYKNWNDKDYNLTVDRKVTKAMLKAYIKDTPKAQLPLVLQSVDNVDAYVDNLFDRSIYRSEKSFAEALAQGDYTAYANDPVVRLQTDFAKLYSNVRNEVAGFDREFAKARQTYVKGILEMEGDMNVWPDANSTIRYTFGRVVGYSPRDNVYYGHQTTMEGVMEKEDPNSPEFYLLPKVKELYDQKNFGPWKMKDGRMPVNICATTHTTGGNSGSPLIDGNGYLVGLNFDRNWEGVGGDINYLPDYQRSIICDVRYVLFILDKYLGAQRLIDEMNIVK